MNAYQVNPAGDGITYKAEQGDHGENYDVFIVVTTSAGQVKEVLEMFRVRSLG
ncbi:MAG: hypothetical protein J0I66_03065 [Microbacterium sp.]|nr:hypothetical protein [Microbacterium sp.]